MPRSGCTDPQERAKSLPAIGGLKLDGWQAQNYATFATPTTDAMTIAHWIDAYFATVLGCPNDYDVNGALQKL